jgi:hypothetical protein
MNRATTHPSIVRYSLYIYDSSRIFRLAAKCLSSPHVAIWNWFRDYPFSAADRFRIDKYKIDKTQIDGLEYWLWVTYEPT